MFNNKQNMHKLGDTKIGDGLPIYIIADVGLTNGGDIDRTFKLIDIASEIGVDAIKFQMIGPDTLLGDKSAVYTYKTLYDGSITENMYDMFSALNYTESEWAKIFEYTKFKKMEFICTSHYFGAVEILERIGVSVHKICTWSLTHKRLIQQIGKTNKPMLLDTGACDELMLNRTIEWYKSYGGTSPIILHDFHTTNVEEMNFKSIPYLKKIYNCPVGYTPQGIDYDMDFLSIGIGANLLEKRLTVDRGIAKNGHIKALEPKEFKNWFDRVRLLEKALGREAIIPTKDDIKQSKKYFKSMYFKKSINAGDIILDTHLESRRPGNGICASQVDNVIGKKINIDKKPGDMLFTKELSDCKVLEDI